MKLAQRSMRSRVKYFSVPPRDLSWVSCEVLQFSGVLAFLFRGKYLLVNRMLAFRFTTSALMLAPTNCWTEAMSALSLQSTHVEEGKRLQPQHSLDAPVQPGVVPARPQGDQVLFVLDVLEFFGDQRLVLVDIPADAPILRRGGPIGCCQLLR